MAAGTITINPVQSGSAGQTYKTDFTGYKQGKPIDNFALLNQFLESGKVSTSETMKMWAGVAIKETINTDSTNHFGNTIARATTVASITGFTVESSQTQMIQAPGQVPVVTPGMAMGFVRLGTKLKIPFPIDPALISSLEGDTIKLTDTAVTIDLDVTSATYGSIIAVGGGTSLATLGIKLWRIGYQNSVTVERGASGNWDVVDDFIYNYSGSVAVLEI